MTKHLKLYIAVFLVSMLFSVTAIIAYADTQQSTTLTYTALSPEEKNHYEVQIPSSVELSKTGGTMKLSVADGYELEDDYQVNIGIPTSLVQVATLALSGHSNCILMEIQAAPII